MVEQRGAVAFAVVVFLVLRITIFFKVPDSETEFLVIPSCLVLASVVLLILDNKIFPARYENSGPKFVQSLIEGILAVFIVEFAMIIVWANIEHVIFVLLKLLLSGVYGFGTEYVAGAIITTLSMTIFIFTLNITKNSEKVLKHLGKFKKDFKAFFAQRRPMQANNCCPNQMQSPVESRQPLQCNINVVRPRSTSHQRRRAK